MKIAVYTIALNEAKHVDRWVHAHQDADYLVVVDTGSVDDTPILLSKHNVLVHNASIKPFRFDDARNTALALIPDDVDVCISVDMDELLSPGWREDVEAKWKVGETTRGKFQFIWSHQEDGSNGITFWYEKMHARHGFRWANPVHEVLVSDRTIIQWEKFGFELHHWPDLEKSRSQYLDLLELATKENPNDPRNAHYYGRELLFHGHWFEAIKELQRHLDMPESNWANERCASMRYLSQCYIVMGLTTEALVWLRRAVAEAPDTREPWVELASLAHDLDVWDECYYAAKKALAIENKPDIYICDPEAWGSKPYDLAAISAFWLGHKAEAKAYGFEAVSLDPTNKRLVDNLMLFTNEEVNV